MLNSSEETKAYLKKSMHETGEGKDYEKWHWIAFCKVAGYAPFMTTDEAFNVIIEAYNELEEEK